MSSPGLACTQRVDPTTTSVGSAPRRATVAPSSRSRANRAAPGTTGLAGRSAGGNDASHRSQLPRSHANGTGQASRVSTVSAGHAPNDAASPPKTPAVAPAPTASCRTASSAGRLPWTS